MLSTLSQHLSQIIKRQTKPVPQRRVKVSQHPVNFCKSLDICSGYAIVLCKSPANYLYLELKAHNLLALIHTYYFPPWGIHHCC